MTTQKYRALCFTLLVPLLVAARSVAAFDEVGQLAPALTLSNSMDTISTLPHCAARLSF